MTYPISSKRLKCKRFDSDFVSDINKFLKKNIIIYEIKNDENYIYIFYIKIKKKSKIENKIENP